MAGGITAVLCPPLVHLVTGHCSEFGASLWLHSSESLLSSAVPVVLAPGVEELDTACLCSDRMGGARQASLIAY